MMETYTLRYLMRNCKTERSKIEGQGQETDDGRTSPETEPWDDLAVSLNLWTLKFSFPTRPTECFLWIFTSDVYITAFNIVL